MKPFFTAIQFLTIIPVRTEAELTPRDMGRSCAYFPLVGAVQGLFAAAVTLVLLKFLPSGVSSVLFVLVLVVTSGGLHQDGLSDTLDALAVRTHGSPVEAMERRLRVMKGSTAGPIGVTGLVLSLLLKVFCLSAIMDSAHDRTGLLLTLLASMTLLGKWSMVSPLVFGQPARSDGLGRLVMAHTGPTEFFGALGTTLAFWLLASLLLVPSGLRAGYLALGLFIMAALFLFSAVLRRLARSYFGGLTGDLFGFMNEVSEMFYLAVATGWLRQST